MFRLGCRLSWEGSGRTKVWWKIGTEPKGRLETLSTRVWPEAYVPRPRLDFMATRVDDIWSSMLMKSRCECDELAVVGQSRTSKYILIANLILVFAIRASYHREKRHAKDKSTLATLLNDNHRVKPVLRALNKPWGEHYPQWVRGKESTRPSPRTYAGMDAFLGLACRNSRAWVRHWWTDRKIVPLVPSRSMTARNRHIIRNIRIKSEQLDKF